VAIADLNDDGKPDLAVTNYISNTVSVLRGNGDGSFGVKSDYATGSVPFSVAIGDLNGDGKPDLAVANNGSNTVSVLLGNGDGSFGAKTDYATGSAPYSVAIGDLNGDGKPDLTVANYNSITVSVLLGNGDGNFSAKTDFIAGTNPISVAIADLNDDGKPDLAVANYGSNTVSVLINTGVSTTGVGRAPPGPTQAFELLAPRPNPCRGRSEIRFVLPSARAVEVALFDVAGRRVRSWVWGEGFPAGPHTVTWDGLDGSGARAVSGLYFVRVRAGRDVGMRKLVLEQ
jgi:hypothetical protein